MSKDSTASLEALAATLPRKPIASDFFTDVFYGSLYVSFDAGSERWEVEWIDGKRNVSVGSDSLPYLLAFVAAHVSR